MPGRTAKFARRAGHSREQSLTQRRRGAIVWVPHCPVWSGAVDQRRDRDPARPDRVPRLSWRCPVTRSARFRIPVLLTVVALLMSMAPARRPPSRHHQPPTASPAPRRRSSMPPTGCARTSWSGSWPRGRCRPTRPVWRRRDAATTASSRRSRQTPASAGTRSRPAPSRASTARRTTRSTARVRPTSTTGPASARRSSRPTRSSRPPSGPAEGRLSRMGRIADAQPRRPGHRLPELLLGRGVLAAPADPSEQAGAAAFGVSYQVAAFAPAVGWTNTPAGDDAVSPPQQSS